VTGPARRAPRILVAGVGNVLRGDDGFGVVTARQLMARNDIPENVTVIETGIGGMSLVQDLMAGYDALVLLDACHRGGQPGQVYLLEPEVLEVAAMEPSVRRDFFADTHYATPSRALALVAAIGSLPRIIRVIGCEAGEVDDYRLGLSPSVELATGRAVEMTIDVIKEIRKSPAAQGSSPMQSPSENSEPG
jgi:hydrogenase maturation protease